MEQALGTGYLDNFYSENAPRSRRQPNQVSGAAAHLNPSQGPPTESIPDLGILKALQGMGEGVRQQLNQLAVQFNNTATAALESIEGKRSRSNSTSGGGGDAEWRPLTATDYEEEDEEPLVASSSYSNTSANLTRRNAGKKEK